MRLILLAMGLLSLMVPVSYGDGHTVDVTAVTLDGDITNAFVRDAADVVIEIDSTGFNRGFIEFDLSALPAGAVVLEVQLRFRTQTITTPGVSDIRLRQMTVQPSTQPDNAAGNQAIYDDINANALYILAENLNSNTWYTYTLGATAVTDMNTHITWFSVGLTATDSNNFIHSSESAGFDPYLIVRYAIPTDYAYTFTDAYYENGTLNGPIDVTATGTFGVDTFNTAGGITVYYPDEPLAFYWSIGGGISRYVYSFGEENFTVTVPEATDYVYSFTVKDYTGKTGLGQSYLEAWRIINGTERLIERMPITQPNAVPLNLVYGRTYHIQILYADGSRYDWGYFAAGADTSNTINARQVTFTDQVQALYNIIYVDATRSNNGQTITVDYNDTRANTVWANVTIYIRNGAQVFFAARNNDTYTMNWANANSSLGYTVVVEGGHGDFDAWSYVKILDEEEEFPDAPSLEGIWDFGLGANLGGWLITTAAVISFSKALQGRALIVGAVVATMLTYIGFVSYTRDQLVFAWFFAIVVAAVTGGSE